jgi:hypothetical protein
MESFGSVALLFVELNQAQNGKVSVSWVYSFIMKDFVSLEVVKIISLLLNISHRYVRLLWKFRIKLTLVAWTEVPTVLLVNLWKLSSYLLSPSLHHDVREWFSGSFVEGVLAQVDFHGARIGIASWIALRITDLGVWRGVTLWGTSWISRGSCSIWLTLCVIV